MATIQSESAFDLQLRALPVSPTGLTQPSMADTVFCPTRWEQSCAPTCYDTCCYLQSKVC
ncbi:hypothetical protein [Nonomuraea dietziae]|uniref:hypothetical protein n=1 Tax=Nonomuraea dietziae TaxID=65515 RepID=UPI0034498641